MVMSVTLSQEGRTSKPRETGYYIEKINNCTHIHTLTYIEKLRLEGLDALVTRHTKGRSFTSVYRQVKVGPVVSWLSLTLNGWLLCDL